jgi:hypothetical protein
VDPRAGLDEFLHARIGNIADNCEPGGLSDRTSLKYVTLIFSSVKELSSGVLQNVCYFKHFQCYHEPF